MTDRTFYSYEFEENKTFPQEVEIDEPRQCMHCEQTGIQNFINGIVTNGQYDIYNGIAFFTCPLCASATIHFLARCNLHTMGYNYPVYKSIETIPDKKEKIKNISNDLQTEFPDFFKIYSQSEKAEKENLNLIAGMGYRKALEYLVTDYLLIYPVADVTEEWLKNPQTTLGNKISKIPNKRMQTLAKATSFLGNNETHYTRKHPEHDIDSMKAFIRVLISEIENEIEFEKAEALINKPKS